MPPRKSKELIFRTSVKSNFDYCSTIFNYANLKVINKLQKIVNSGVRAILNAQSVTNVSCMLKELKLLSIKDAVYVNSIFI